MPKCKKCGKSAKYLYLCVKCGACVHDEGYCNRLTTRDFPKCEKHR